MQKLQIKITKHQIGQAVATIQDAIQHLQQFLTNPTDPEGLAYSLRQRLGELQALRTAEESTKASQFDS